MGGRLSLCAVYALEVAVILDHTRIVLLIGRIRMFLTRITNTRLLQINSQ